MVNPVVVGSGVAVVVYSLLDKYLLEVGPVAEDIAAKSTVESQAVGGIVDNYSPDSQGSMACLWAVIGMAGDKPVDVARWACVLAEA